MEVKEPSAKYLVRPRYKQTEVGVIPEDWDAPELGDIMKSKQLGGNYKNSEAPTNWPLIKMGNLGRGSIKLDKLEFVASSQPPAISDRLHEGDVLFNTRNTLDLVGKVAIWRSELPEAYFNSNIMRMEFDRKHVSSNRFMNSILNTQRSLRSLRGIATGTTSVAAIYGRDLAKIRVPLPTKAEQEAIAEALSDADALIESLDQLIVKKRQLKQGAMQELLTGKRRLPGFSGEWEVKRLGELADMGSGGTPPSSNLAFYDGNIPWVAISDMTKGGKYIASTERNLSAEGFSNCAAQMFPVGTVLYAMYASLGECSIATVSLSSSQAILGIRAKSRMNSEFLYYFLLSIKPQVKTMGQQGTQANLNKGMVQEFELHLPLLLEQTAIATLLGDMDTELAELQTRLAKARQLKQGMMQELLTGRIRLL